MRARARAPQQASASAACGVFYAPTPSVVEAAARQQIGRAHDERCHCGGGGAPASARFVVVVAVAAAAAAAAAAGRFCALARRRAAKSRAAAAAAGRSTSLAAGATWRRARAAPPRAASPPAGGGTLTREPPTALANATLLMPSARARVHGNAPRSLCARARNGRISASPRRVPWMSANGRRRIITALTAVQRRHRCRRYHCYRARAPRGRWSIAAAAAALARRRRRRKCERVTRDGQFAVAPQNPSGVSGAPARALARGRRPPRPRNGQRPTRLLCV